jgi:hypothetical protein
MNAMNAFIDLDDFDAGGKDKFFEYPKGFDTRAFNMARVLEHEFLGHVMSGCVDYPDGKPEEGLTKPGENEDNMNVMRRQMGLPLRLIYGGPLLKDGTTIGISFGIYDKKGTAIEQFGVKQKILPRTPANGLLMNSETAEEIK